MDKNKNVLLGIGIGVLVIGLLIATMFIGSDNSTASTMSEDPNVIVANAERESKSITEDQMAELEKINMTKYMDYYNGNETKIIFIGRPTCPYCEMTQPIIRKIAKDHNLTISYLNTDEFSDDDNVKFVQHNEAFAEGYGTPMILLVSNGEIEVAIEGLTDTAHFEEFFRKAGFIK